jgi:hypothetical protein
LPQVTHAESTHCEQIGNTDFSRKPL